MMQRTSILELELDSKGAEHRKCAGLFREVASEEDKLADVIAERFGQRAYETIRLQRRITREALVQAGTMRTYGDGTA